MRRLSLLCRDGPASSSDLCPAVAPGSLSPDGTFLAINGLNGFTVIALDGQALVGFDSHPTATGFTWVDDDKVLVSTTDSPTRGTIYDVTTGKSLGASDQTVQISGFTGGTPYGQQAIYREAAQSYSVDDDGLREFTGAADGAPADVTVAVDQTVQILAHPGSDGSGCCPVVGWTSLDTVAYQSPTVDGSIPIVAWKLGSTDFSLLTTLVDVPEDTRISWAQLPVNG